MSSPDQRVSLGIGDAMLSLRPGIAHRSIDTEEGRLVYLSLFDDEIEDRLAALLSCTEGRPFEAAHEIELVDTVVLASADGALRVARGACSTIPLYAHEASAHGELETRLPVDAGALSATGLLATMAAACWLGSFEPEAWSVTALEGWRRLRRGAVTTLRADSADDVRDIRQPSVAADAASEPAVIDRIRAAFDAYAHSQRRVRRSVVELSGGFDSTLAVAGLRGPAHTMHGISAEFPYYEFRFESPVQRAVAEALAIPRTSFDGTTAMPFAPGTLPARFDEPAVFVTGLRHAEIVGRFATDHRAERLYVGHGGDHLFAMALGASQPRPGVPARACFGDAARASIARFAMAASAPDRLRRGDGRYVYDARQDLWMKETFGASVRSPFADLALFRAGAAWSASNRKTDTHPDKTILARALPALLPRAVIERKGKVAYDGVWMRAYAEHGDHIARTIDVAAPLFERIGIKAGWLLARVRDLADWKTESSPEVLGAYAIATWLQSWGIDGKADIRDLDRPTPR